MARGVGQLVVEFVAATAKYQADLGKAAAAAEATAKRIDRAISGLRSNVTNSIKGAAAGLIAGFGLSSVSQALENIKQQTMDSQRSINQLNAVLRATGSAAGLTTQSLEELNSEVQKNSIFDDDQIRAAETALLRFRKVQGDVFKDAIRLTPDLAAALNTDLPSAAIALGRALSDPEKGMRALKEAGVFLSESQKDVAARLNETGRSADAQRVVLDELAKSVGGSGEADNKGIYGATKRMERAWNDLLKATGRKIYADNGRNLDALSNGFDALAKKIDQSDLSLQSLLLGLIKFEAMGVPGLIGMIGKAAQGQTSGRYASGKIDTRAYDEARAKEAAATQAAKIAEDERYTLRKQADVKRAETAAEAFRGELLLQQYWIQKSEANLESSYQRQETSTAAYYDGLKRSAIEASRIVTEYNNKQIESFYNLARDTRFNPQERMQFEAKAESLVNQENQQRYALALKLDSITEKQIRDQEKLNDEYAKLSETLYEFSTDAVGVALMRLDAANRDLLRKIDAQLTSPDANERQQAQRARDIYQQQRVKVGQQADLNDKASEFGRILDEVGMSQERINIAQRTGAISELEALNLSSKANAERIAQLKEIADAYEQIAVQFGRPEFMLAAQQMKLKIEELAASTNLLADKFREIFVDSFTDAVVDVVNGTKSISDAFRQMERAIVSSISRIAANNIATAIFGQGSMGGAGINWLAGLFGGGGGATSMPWSSTTMDPFGFFGLPGMASGGMLTAGQPAVVGEKGPELFIPKTSGNVVPNDVLRAKRASRGNITINVNVPPSTTRSTADQIAVQTARAVNRAIYRNA